MKYRDKKRLKVAYFLGAFPVTSQTFIINQIVELLDRGHEVQILALEENRNFVLHQKIAEYNLLEKTVYSFQFSISKLSLLRIVRLSIHLLKNFEFKRFYKKFKFFSFQNKAFDLNLLCQYYWILSAGNFDLIHAHFGPNGAFIADLKLKGFFSRTKLLTSFHGYDLHPKLMLKHQLDYRKLFLEADGLIVNSIYSKKLLQTVTDRKDITVLPVGLNTNNFKLKKKKVQRDNFKILFVGRLITIKAPDLVVEIFRFLCTQKGFNNITLTIVGDGEMKEYLSALIDAYNLKKYVSLLGARSQEEIKEIMSESDILLMPGVCDQDGHAETQGLVIQEAQAMELPVLVSNVGGMKYGIIDGKTGYVVKERDIEAFVEKIEILIKNVELRHQMGKEGRKYVVREYDSKVLGTKLKNMYKALIKKENFTR